MGIITRSIANNIVTGGKLDGTDGLSGVISASNIENASLTNITALSSNLGDAIESVSTDPVSPSEGQLWYNTTIGVLKGYQLSVAAFSTGGNLSTARYALAGAGTQTTGLAFGGFNGTAMVGQAEEYNGSSWTAGGTMGTARYRLAGAGTQTAALATRGFAPSPISQTGLTEEYDGSTWTAGGTNPVIGSASGATGTQTAGLNFGGSPNLSSSQEYDGSTWAGGGTLNTGRSILGGAGTQTAGLAFGAPTATESYNGTSWTSVNSLNNSIQGGCGATNTSALAFTGTTPIGVESWDGTNWTNISATLGTPRSDFYGCGIQTSALVFGGQAPSITAATEEYTGAFLSVKKVTTS